MLELVDEDLSHYILGETDSEVIFFILLSSLRKFQQFENLFIIKEQFIKAMELALNNIQDIIGRSFYILLQGSVFVMLPIKTEESSKTL